MYIWWKEQKSNCYITYYGTFLGLIFSMTTSIFTNILQVCHQEPEHKTGYGQGTHGYNSNYHHKPEVCHYENKQKCMEEHKNVCHYETEKIPHKEPQKVPEKICTYQKHHSYGK